MRVHVCVKKMETETDRQLRDSGQEHGLSCVLVTLLRALTTDLRSHMYQTTNIPSRPGALQETQEDTNKCDLVLCSLLTPRGPINHSPWPVLGWPTKVLCDLATTMFGSAPSFPFTLFLFVLLTFAVRGHCTGRS